MDYKIKIEIAASVIVTLGNKEVVFSIEPKKTSEIMGYNLLNEEDLPEDFSEITGFERVDEENEIASIREVLLISHAIIPQMFLVSIGQPLLFQCSRKLAMYSEKIYKNKFNVTILRGSLRQDNPYPPLESSHGSYYFGKFDDDTHIVMLSRIEST